MKIIYETLTKEGKDISIKEVTENKATHKHTCYHDEGKGRPCKREKI